MLYLGRDKRHIAGGYSVFFIVYIIISVSSCEIIYFIMRMLMHACHIYDFFFF